MIYSGITVFMDICINVYERGRGYVSYYMYYMYNNRNSDTVLQYCA